MSAKEEKVAIVTGANKGIGFAVVKGLAEQFDGVIYLTGAVNLIDYICLSDCTILIEKFVKSAKCRAWLRSPQ